MRNSNYDKYPATFLNESIWKGWHEITGQIKQICENKEPGKPYVLVVECYHGVDTDQLAKELQQIDAKLWMDVSQLYKPAEEIERMTRPYLTDDRIFGKRASFTYQDFLDKEKVKNCQQHIAHTEGLTIVYGHGAAEVIPHPDMLIYADMARWEIQQRFRRKEINGLGVENKEEAPSLHYKRGYFIDWIICDMLKKKLIPQVHYWLDTHQPDEPKLISGETFRKGLEKTVRKPFRVVPFFDPAPWGGQWMKEVCGLDKETDNYGWCFDCVPEENSLYLNVQGEQFEMPANNLVFYKTTELLGAPVEARFGQDFPIRFDFLDTMQGGNLSLQVHPTTQYIRDHFGIYYTQDESYYLLDTTEEATVYLGLKEGIDPRQMISDLEEAQETGKTFDTSLYVNQWPAQKHDHYLIPGGTIHCSGAGAMVLEISSTPSIFTFKLWDWGRLGLDGLPRPINIRHGKEVIQWNRNTAYAKEHLINQAEEIASGEGWIEERTGLHENEFIETRRHWFTATVPHHTGGGVNVLNLIEGEEAIVESPDNAFEPFVVHYAETFIIPAIVGSYTIRPYGLSEGKKCGTIKAYVRFRQ